MRKLFRVGMSGVNVLTLVGVLLIGGMAPAAAAGSRANPATQLRVSATWTLHMHYSTGLQTFILKPLTITGSHVSGKFIANGACRNTFSSTYHEGHIAIVFNFIEVCDGAWANLKGTLSWNKGEAQGTFTASIGCHGVCAWTGEKQ